MDYWFEIGKGKKVWSESCRAHFHETKDSIWLVMTKKQTIEMIQRLSTRLLENPTIPMDGKMPWVGYSGEVTKTEEW